LTRYLRGSDGDIYETADSLALTVSELLAIIANESFVVVRHTGNVHGVAYSNDSGCGEICMVDGTGVEELPEIPARDPGQIIPAPDPGRDGADATVFSPAG
jgi:hypothetical protein